MKLKHIFIGIILVMSTFLAGCNSQEEKTTTEESTESTEQVKVETLKIYTTLYPLMDFTKKIGGDHVDVESIMPPGADAHTFEPTSKQMINIAEADAFIFNGLNLETYAESIASALENEKTLMVGAAEGVNSIEHNHAHEGEDEHGHEGEEHAEDEHAHEGDVHAENEHAHEGEEHAEDEHAHEGEEHVEDEHAHEGEEHAEDEHAHEGDVHVEDEHGHEHGDMDPHIWLDPYRATVLAENIKNALVELKPDAKDEFEKNFAALKEELEALDEEFHHLVESKTNPEMIVSHAAYGYWEESYGVHQIAVSGLSPSDEPSQKQLEEIIDLANEKQIKYVIFEQNVTPKVAEIIRTEINAEPLRLHNLSVLTEEDIENGEDYFSLMKKNLETLNKALN